MRKILLIPVLMLLAFVSCNKTTQSTAKTGKSVQVPAFSADSAYSYIEKQVSFGPRVPNSSGHEACGNWLEQKLSDFGAEVTVQKADLTAFDGTVLKAKNIIASFNPEASKRILLFAHWDTRPWADHDPESNNRTKPILGANDGASGVGVLLEMARQFGLQAPAAGVDIILFDAEDYGAPEYLSNADNVDSWCLGSQYWSKNKHKPNYRAKYGILLDMVGAPGAKFYREQISDYYAKYVVDNVWRTAASLGFGNYFIDSPGGAITDDHLYVNQLAGIPAIDIIQYEPDNNTGFGHYWHTMDDTMEHIDKNTLQAVGATVTYIVYNE